MLYIFTFEIQQMCLYVFHLNNFIEVEKYDILAIYRWQRHTGYSKLYYSQSRIRKHSTLRYES